MRVCACVCFNTLYTVYVSFGYQALRRSLSRWSYRTLETNAQRNIHIPSCAQSQHQHGIRPLRIPCLLIILLFGQVISMTARLLDGGDGSVCGIITSGGTESIVLATKAHRDFYREVRLPRCYYGECRNNVVSGSRRVGGACYEFVCLACWRSVVAEVFSYVHVPK